MDNPIERIIFTNEDIQRRNNELGCQITADFKDRQSDGIVLITILKGAVVFMTDLARHIKLELEYDFMAVSSYLNSTSSQIKPKITQDLTCDITGKHVIICEDIIDSGNSMNFIVEYLKEKNPKSISVAVLLHKHIENASCNVNIDYLGFDCPKEFVVGYGFDYLQRYRNLPYIGVLKKELYS